MSSISSFFEELDDLWEGDGRHRLNIIGSGALMLAEVKYSRATDDGDVLETRDLEPAVKAQLEKLAGRGTPLHLRRRMRIDIVNEAVPFLPQRPQWNQLNQMLEHFDLYALDVVDVVVSKLKPWRPRDQRDIDAMVQANRVPHARLVQRVRDAIDMWNGDARAEEYLPMIVDNLHTVERDMLRVPESEIELPTWI